MIEMLTTIDIEAPELTREGDTYEATVKAEVSVDRILIGGGNTVVDANVESFTVTINGKPVHVELPDALVQRIEAKARQAFYRGW